MMDVPKSIEESTSFRPIYKKYYTGFHGKGDERYYEIKFKISVEDYEKNNLQYNDSENTAELLIDTHFKKKRITLIFVYVEFQI